MQRFFLLFAFFTVLSSNALLAQIRLSVVLDSATVNTSCGDLLSSPDPSYQISVNGRDRITYDFGNNACFRTAPDIPYDTLVDGACNLPRTIDICVRAFENDGGLIPCFVFPTCFERSCATFSVPATGINSQEQVVVTGTTEGVFYFTIRVEDDPMDFNFICGAQDLGLLTSGDTLGSANDGIYNNNCADNLNEINPVTDSGVDITNDHGVWFRYTTGADVSRFNYVRAFSDPEGLGDPIDLELLVYNADSCTGELSRFPLFRISNTTYDASIELFCVLPNTTYYIFVDGRGTEADQQGVFGIVVEDPGLPEGADLICDAFDLGAVPENGSVSLPTAQSNACAGFSDDPPGILNFNSRNSVWVRFDAPSSGHILVEGFSRFAIDLELALYQSTTDDCNGTFRHLYSGWTNGDFNESFTFSCLDSGRPYWILIDGSALGSHGYFDLSVTDLGDIRSVFMQTDSICAGESITVGANITHDVTGVYMDTLKIGDSNCDSIVITDLTVLDPITVSFQQTRPAIGANGTNGEGIVLLSGGTGDYDISWCDGSNGTTNNNLVAGTECCITISDTRSCAADTCFMVDYVDLLSFNYTTDMPDCNGATNGSFSFEVAGDQPVYSYQWTNADASFTGSGTIEIEGETVTVDGLGAGTYTVSCSGQYTTIDFDIVIEEPPLLTIAIDELRQISCYQACDGFVSVSVAGGTGDLELTPVFPSQGEGCAGTYTFTVTDANGCVASLEETLVEPVEFIAMVASSQDVSCFDGNDGTIAIATNGNPVSYTWSNGDNSSTVNGLRPGTYAVTVTNDDGCEDVVSHMINQPIAPLQVLIDEVDPIVCNVDANGVLAAVINGGTAPISYAWSTGGNTATIRNLGPDNYTVTVTDANGCTAIQSYLLSAPAPLLGSTTIRNLRCFEAANSGMITIVEVEGGLPPYLYAIDGNTFGADSIFDALEAGRYDVTIQDALGCELVITTSVLPPPDLVVDLGRDRNILLGDSILLRAITNSTDVVYNWSLDDRNTANELYLRPEMNRSVSVQVRDTLTNCIADASITILVDRRARIYVPTAFSPNGDGINDIFFPFGGTDVGSVDDFRIFDRYGNIVYAYEQSFNIGNPQIGWDGYVKGEKAAIGVYVYTATINFIDGRTNVIKGEVTLVR